MQNPSSLFSLRPSKSHLIFENVGQSKRLYRYSCMLHKLKVLYYSIDNSFAGVFLVDMSVFTRTKFNRRLYHYNLPRSKRKKVRTREEAIVAPKVTTVIRRCCCKFLNLQSCRRTSDPDSEVTRPRHFISYHSAKFVF